MKIDSVPVKKTQRKINEYKTGTVFYCRKYSSLYILAQVDGSYYFVNLQFGSMRDTGRSGDESIPPEMVEVDAVCTYIPEE